ncbi:MAG: hypothetical protein RML99_03300 [Anaerolineae bacterium]|nr:hypothetical protein [Anaerolineae bacterium]
MSDRAPAFAGRDGEMLPRSGLALGACIAALLALALNAAPIRIRAPDAPPTLADLWHNRAEFIVERQDTGLPMGESDTVIAPNGEWWSYVHASHRSAKVHDRCGAPVAFPGCVVIYKSRDEGQTFALDAPVCQIECGACPCDADRDHVQQQQYPRVARTPRGWFMVYEFGGRVMLRRSTDGLIWGEARWVFNTGVWTRQIRPCRPWEEVRPHPFATADYECLAGGPPGIYADDDVLYVFMAMGQNPGAMGCMYLNLTPPAEDTLPWPRPGRADRTTAPPPFEPSQHPTWIALSPCDHNPLFVGHSRYGDVRDTGAMSNAHFDHRTISSAEVIKVGERYYMLYEGIRGPGPGDVGDNQFGLGLARSTTARVDGPWEKLPQPLLVNLPGNIGLGHADVVITPRGETIVFTSLDGVTRSRLKLVWKRSATPTPAAAAYRIP